jgi:hypothetical protein
VDFSVSGSRYRGELRGINTLSIDSDVWPLKVRRALLRLPAIGSIVGCYRSSQSARKLGFAKLAFKAGINPALRRAALSIYKLRRLARSHVISIHVSLICEDRRENRPSDSSVYSFMLVRSGLRFSSDGKASMSNPLPSSRISSFRVLSSRLSSISTRVARPRRSMRNGTYFIPSAKSPPGRPPARRAYSSQRG